MVQSDLIIRNETEFDVEECSFTDGDWDIRSKSDALTVRPWRVGKSNMYPNSGFFGVHKGVGGVYSFNVLGKGGQRGRFQVKVACPAVGSGSVEVWWHTKVANVDARATYDGTDPNSGAHVHTVYLNTIGVHQSSGISSDGRLGIFEAIPVVGLGISAGHAIAGSEDQAKRAAIASGASTLATVATVATGGAAAPALGVFGSGFVGGMAGALVNNVAQHGFNDLQTSAAARTTAGGWDRCTAESMVVGTLAGGVLGGVGSAAGGAATAHLKQFDPGMALRNTGATNLAVFQATSAVASGTANMPVNYALKTAQTTTRSGR